MKTSPRAINGEFLQNRTPESPDIYTPPHPVYKEPVKQVIDNLELCFQRKKGFHREDHNMLTVEEQEKFAP
jgi:hypothetical protein